MSLPDEKIRDALTELGITTSLLERLSMPLQQEAAELVECEHDMFDRPQQMTPKTKECWEAMKRAAAEDGVTLQLVSAYRSVDYQCNLIRNKIDKGQAIEDILQVNAAPGYSEHHTGRALDLSTPQCEPLSETFEDTEAFKWLTENASRFSFSMTYPKDNPFDIVYEPWHWACNE